jgi:hypothetical protein
MTALAAGMEATAIREIMHARTSTVLQIVAPSSLGLAADMERRS